MRKLITLSLIIFVLFSSKMQASIEEKDPFQIVKTNSNQYDFSTVKGQKEFTDFIIKIKSKYETHQNVPELRFLIEDAWGKAISKNLTSVEKTQITYESLKKQNFISLSEINAFFAQIATGYSKEKTTPHNKWYIPIMITDPHFDINVLNYAFLNDIYFIGYPLSDKIFYHGNPSTMVSFANHDEYHSKGGQQFLDVYEAIYNYALKTEDKKLNYSLFWMWHEVQFNLLLRDLRLEKGYNTGDDNGYAFYYNDEKELPHYIQEKVKTFNLLSLPEKIKYLAVESLKSRGDKYTIADNPIVPEIDDIEERKNYYKYNTFNLSIDEIKDIQWEEGEENDKVMFINYNSNISSLIVELYPYAHHCINSVEGKIDEISFLSDLGIKMINTYQIKDDENTSFRKVIAENPHAFGKELNALFKEHMFYYLYNLADKIAENSFSKSNSNNENK